MSEAQAAADGAAEAVAPETPDAANDNGDVAAPAPEASPEGMTAEQGSAMAEAIENAEEVRPGVHRVKIDGEEIEVSTEELERGYQRARAAAKRFEEASALRKQLDSEKEQIRGWVESLKGDPITMLEQLGVDMRSKIEEHYSTLLAREQMSPEQRELHDLKAKMRQQESEKAERERQAREQAEQAAATQYRERFTSELTEALDMAGIPADDRAAYIPQAAALMRASLREDGTSALTVQDIARHLVEEEGKRRDRFVSSRFAELQELDGDALLEAIPETIQSKLRAALLAKVKNPAEKGVRVAPPKPKAKPQGQPKRRITSAEAFTALLNERRGL